MTPTRHLHIAFDIRALLSKALQHDPNVNFEWVPSHCGLNENELADTATNVVHSSASTIVMAGSHCVGRE